MKNKYPIDFTTTNYAQKEAITTTKGPLIVIAGPGTGKTHILTKRVANILNEDESIGPENILCVTFTDAGAQNMRNRLRKELGKEGNKVEIGTFHSFAQSIIKGYNEYFPNSNDKLVTDLQTKRFLLKYVKGLTKTDPLSGYSQKFKYLQTFISNLKKSDLTSNDIETTIGQNNEFITFLTNSDLSSILTERKSKKLMDSFYETFNIVHEFNYLEDLKGYKDYIPLKDKFIQDFNNSKDDYDKFKSYIDEWKKIVGETEKSNRTLQSLNTSYLAYDKYMNDNNLIDFDDMILNVVETIQNNPDLQKELHSKYQYILVDEFQDTNGVQQLLIDLIAKNSETGDLKNSNVMTVGDDDQAIMRFQGARVQGMRAFACNYNAKIITMNENYRSQENIIEAGNKVAVQVEGRLIKEKTNKIGEHSSNKIENNKIEYLFYEDLQSELSDIASKINKLINEGESPNEIAIIAPKHYLLQNIIPYLEHEDKQKQKNKIAFNYKLKMNLYEIQPLKYIFALLNLINTLDKTDEGIPNSYLPELLSHPYFELESKELIEIVKIAKHKKGENWLNIIENSNNTKLKEFAKHIYDSYINSKRLPTYEAIRQLSNPFYEFYSNKEYLKNNSFEALTFFYGMKKFLDWTKSELDANEDKNNNISKCLDLLQEAQNFGIELNVDLPIINESAINLWSVHSSKGLEAKHIFLINCDNKTWNGTQGHNPPAIPKNVYLFNNKDLNDNKRNLFVAITRAKTNLYISYNMEKSKDITGYNQFLEIPREKVVNKEGEDEENLMLDNKPRTEIELLEIAKNGWFSAYYQPTPEFNDLIREEVFKTKISAKLLNNFLTGKNFDNSSKTSEDFIRSTIYKFPSPGAIAPTFGIIVHDIISQYVINKDKSDFSEKKLLEDKRKELESLEFEESDIKRYLFDFDNFKDNYFESFKKEFNGKLLKTEIHINAFLDDIPIHGYIDLLEIDEINKTVKIFDFKTGKDSDKKNYIRQLVFYIVLLENSKEYSDYEIISAEDVYVIQQKNDIGGLEFLPNTIVGYDKEKIEEMKKLIRTIWDKLQKLDFELVDLKKLFPILN